MQSTLSLTLDLTQKKGFFTDTTDYNAIGVDVNTLGATGSVVVYFQGELLPGPSPTINLAGGTTSSLFDLELDLNGEVANGSYSAVYTINYNFISSVSSVAPNQLTIQTLGSNYQGFPAGTFITVPVNLALGANVVSATDNGGDLEIIVDGTVTSIPPASRTITAEQSGGSFSWVYAGCDLVEAKSALVADCDYGDFGTFTVSNETNTTGITINSLTADINYPGWTNEPVITVTSLPYTNNELATGTYSVTLTQEIEKVQNDGLIIIYTASSIQEFKVSCIGSLCGLNDCLENLRAAHEAELLRNKISKYQVFVDNILIYYTEAQSYKSCGQMDEYRAAVAKIEAQLDASGCDCGCCDENQYIWVQNTSPAASSIIQDIVDLQNDVATINGDITVIEGDIVAIQGNVATLQSDSIFTANNGLTKAGNNVALGGTLLGDTTINAAGNTLNIESNATDALVVKTTTGSPASFTVTSPTGTIADNVRLVTTALLGPGPNGIGSGLSFEAEKANSAVGVTSVVKSSWEDSILGDGKFEIDVATLTTPLTRFTINPDGQVQFNQYGQGFVTGSETYFLGVDINGKVVETGIITADNGLTKTASNIQLGGPLTQNTDITTGAYSLTVDGILKAKKGSVTNSVTDTITLVGYRSNAVGGNGLGSSILFKAEDASSNESFVGKISAKWQDVLNTESQIDISNTDALGEQVRMSIFSDGAVRLSEYGTGSFTGTYEYALMVDSIGNIIEKSAPKTYAAVLSQSGTFDPVVTTILDEINITGIVRVSAGVYNVVSLGQFTANKTISIITQGAANDSIVTAQRTSANSVRITTTIAGVATDTLLSGASLKIEVYP
jgi:hypothetical protein